MTKQCWIRLAALLSALALIIGLCAAYVSDYYRADEAAMAAFMPETAVNCTPLRADALAFGTGNEEVGFIFYPGGKVEHTAYTPLMRQLAAEGVLCVLLEMPFNLAVLDINAAEGIREMYPQVARWYLGGHSLGGTMAGYYAADHSGAFQGLVLLGSYVAKDLSDTALAALSIYGSEDQVMNRSKYDASRALLPADLTEIVIDGGCHAYFGMYGAQAGDGIPAITPEEQIRQTADAICSFVRREGSDAENH